MSYYAFEGLIPVVHPTAFVHPSAVLIGDVIVGAGVYIGPLASLRGDYGRLIVQAGANIQDGCIMHGYCDTDTIVGENGHIGHGAILHGCVIGRDALVGMNSVIMDGAVIGEEHCCRHELCQSRLSRRETPVVDGYASPRCTQC